MQKRSFPIKNVHINELCEFYYVPCWSDSGYPGSWIIDLSTTTRLMLSRTNLEKFFFGFGNRTFSLNQVLHTKKHSFFSKCFKVLMLSFSRILSFPMYAGDEQLLKKLVLTHSSKKPALQMSTKERVLQFTVIFLTKEILYFGRKMLKSYPKKKNISDLKKFFIRPSARW